MNFLVWFLAHLWGAYAIPLALSVVRCTIFGANIYHVPGFVPPRYLWRPLHQS